MTYFFLSLWDFKKRKNCVGLLKKNYKFIAFQNLLHWLPDDIDMMKKLTKTKNILVYLLFFLLDM